MDAAEQRAFVIDAVLADPVCAAVLERTDALGLGEWWLTAGAVFQNVWNRVCGFPPGHGIKDYDVFYFDPDLSWAAEDRVIRRADELFGDLLAGRGAVVELRNEARVHLWYEERFGVPARPFRTAAEAIDCFASSTCSVGVTSSPDGWAVHAPYGLDDVLALHLRPNRRLAPRGVYEAKVREYTRRWPALTSDSW